MILAHFIGKKNWQIDARSRRRVGPYHEEVSDPAAGKPRGQTNPRAQAARLTGATHLHAADRRRCIDRGCSCRARCFFEMRCFRKALLCSAAARKSASTTTEAAPAPRRSHWSGRSVVEHRRGCFEMRAARRERRNLQQSIGRNAACIDRGRSSVSRQRWYGASRAGTEHKFPVRRRPGCGTGLIHCGGQTDRRFAAEMR